MATHGSRCAAVLPDTLFPLRTVHRPRRPPIPYLDSSWQNSSMALTKQGARRVLLHLDAARREPLEPEEVFLLRADGDETVVRTRGKRRLRDVRSLGEVVARFPPGTFVQIHRSIAVNVDRVAEVRRRPNERDWELRLEPPVNQVLPIARARLAALWAAYGERG